MSDRESDRYIVVARRYRPQDFESLIGQGPLVQTLRNAIEGNRVGHAYLFTGARGVGKTSAARIFAKALNCEKGPTTSPCNQCDSCLAVSTGDDVDVLEIDGASNRGIDEIRQLRANVGFRPSRSRYKIYIIDEVHMLSRDAFNALLKTLEEPPSHVKFIFCTTDAEKVPITVVSRCQRFDFAPISTGEIVRSLSEIVAAEHSAADPDALELLARRAEGSLRDSQSLLEQVLSSVDGKITLEVVHQLLGTAPQQQVTQIMESLLHHDAKSALEAVDGAIGRGVDVGQFCEQLLSMMRDTMVVGVGCGSESLKSVRAEQIDTLRTWAEQWGTHALLNALQILEQTLGRMRGSVHRRSLLEIALVQIANLHALDEVAALARRTGTAAAVDTQSVSSKPPERSKDQKKKEQDQASVTPRVDPSQENVHDAPPLIPPISVGPTGPGRGVPDPTDLWRRVTETAPGLSGSLARRFQQAQFDERGRLVVTLESDFQREQCERPERRKVLQETLSRLVAGPIELELRAPEATAQPTPRSKLAAAREREKECLGNPLVQQAVELFEADVTSVHVRQEKSR